MAVGARLECEAEAEAQAGEALRLATKADLGVGCMGEGRQAENRP